MSNILHVLQFGGRADGHVKVYGRHLDGVVEITRVERVDDIVRELAKEHEIGGGVGDTLLEALRKRGRWGKVKAAQNGKKLRGRRKPYDVAVYVLLKAQYGVLRGGVGPVREWWIEEQDGTCWRLEVI